MKIHSCNLLFCNPDFFLEQKKQSLKKFCARKNYDFLFYKIEKDNYAKIAQQIKQELFTSSLTYPKKILFIEKISFLWKQKNLNLDFFFHYLQKSRNDIIIYLAEQENNFHSSVLEKFKPYCQFQTITKMNQKELYNYITYLFEKDHFVIQPQIIKQLVCQNKSDLWKLNNNIEKIKLYYWAEKKNVDNQIINLICSDEETNIFLLIENIINNHDKHQILLLFKKIINKQNDIFKLTYQILIQLKKIIVLKHLKEITKNTQQIDNLSKIINQQNYFYTKKIENLENKYIYNLFFQFLEFYIQIKKGHIGDVCKSFEMMLLKKMIP